MKKKKVSVNTSKKKKSSSPEDFEDFGKIEEIPLSFLDLFWNQSENTAGVDERVVSHTY